MTDDIVKRLNLPWPDDASVEEVTLPAWALELMGQAAAEITALRADVGLWKLRSGNRERLLTDVEAERDRLREALEEIATDEHPLGWIAIAALTTKGKD